MHSQGRMIATMSKHTASNKLLTNDSTQKFSNRLNTCTQQMTEFRNALYKIYAKFITELTASCNEKNVQLSSDWELILNGILQSLESSNQHQEEKNRINESLFILEVLKAAEIGDIIETLYHIEDESKNSSTVRFANEAEIHIGNLQTKLQDAIKKIGQTSETWADSANKETLSNILVIYKKANEDLSKIIAARTPYDYEISEKSVEKKASNWSLTSLVKSLFNPAPTPEKTASASIAQSAPVIAATPSTISLAHDDKADSDSDDGFVRYPSATPFKQFGTP